jgi:ornithine carbamoyltransferase
MANTGPDHAAVTVAKDFLSVLDLSADDLQRLLELARQMKADRRLGCQAPTSSALAGRHVAMLFEKPSLRTRATFEIAVKEVGAETLHVPSAYADGTREQLSDVARNLERWVHALVVRTYAQKKVVSMAEAAPKMHVINALSDEQHPCQALADMMTLQEHWGFSLRGRRLAFVGDGNNVATSLAHAAALLGVPFHVASPPGYELPPSVVTTAREAARDGAELRLFTDPHEAVRGVDAVYTDVWTSMGQEREAERRKHIFAPYQVNADLMASAAPHALFMHCLPAHRGEEVTSEVLDSAASVVFDQAENRLHTQKALLLMLLS